MAKMHHEIIRTLMNAFWLIISGCVSLFIAFWLLPEISLKLSSIDTTTIGTFAALFAYYQVVANFGTNITGMSDYASSDDRFLDVYLVVRIINTISFLCVSTLIFKITGRSIFDYWIFILFISMQTFSILWFAQYNGKQARVAQANLLGIVVSFFCMSFLFDKYELNLQIAYFIFVLPSLFIAMYLSWLILQFARPELNLKKIKKYYQKNLRVFLSQILSIGYTYSGVLILSRFTLPSELSEFVILEKMYLSLSAGFALLFTAAQPSIVDIAKHNVASARALMIKVSLLFILSAIAIAFFLVKFEGWIFGRYFNIDSIFFRETRLLFNVWFILNIVGPITTLMLVILNMRDQIFTLTICIFVITFTTFICMGLFSIKGWLLSMIVGQSLPVGYLLYFAMGKSMKHRGSS